jgi:RNA-directed DNA polymerase
MRSSRVQSAFHKAKQHIGTEFANEVAEHGQRYEHLLRGLAAAEAAGNRRKARETQNLILRSYSAKLICLVRSLQPGTSLTGDSIKEIAASLDPRKDCGEKITVRAEPKSSGTGWRAICSFGLKRQTLHRLVVDILDVRFGTDTINYQAKGKGAERASDRIVELYEQHELPFYVIADIKECFRSVQHERVSEAIGLPKEVVRNSILISSPDSLSVVGGFPPGCTIVMLVGAAQEGLPQGSRVSEKVAAIMLGPALRSIASAERIVSLSDDIALAASSLHEAKALTKALIGVFESHPTGPFRLKHCEIEHINDGFSFLQYYHRRDAFAAKVHRRPAKNSYLRYRRKVTALFVENDYRAAFRHCARYRWHWMRSFRRWRWVWLSKLLLWQTTVDAIQEGLRIKSKKAAQKAA